MTDYDFKLATYNIAKHEAGHWLSAHSHGWAPREIFVKVPSHPKAHYGYALSSYRTTLNTMKDVRDYARARVKVLYSGAHAENFDGTDFDHDQIHKDMMRGGGANSDFFKAEEIYFFYYNCLDNPKGWEEEFNPIINDVKMLIVMRYKFIEAVAEKFSHMAEEVDQEITLTQDELVHLYGQTVIELSPPE